MLGAREPCISKGDVMLLKKLTENSATSMLLGEARTDYGSNIVYLIQGNDGHLHIVFIRKCD
jgi:hypothetical protein